MARSMIGNWYWYNHRIWGWLEVRVLYSIEPGVFHCFSPPCMVYTLDRGLLKRKRGAGKVYPHNPGMLPDSLKPQKVPA